MPAEIRVLVGVLIEVWPALFHQNTAFVEVVGSTSAVTLCSPSARPLPIHSGANRGHAQNASNRY